MAFFKDKTGRGEVNYKGPVQGDNGKVLYFPDDSFQGVLPDEIKNQNGRGGSTGHVVFQLRGEGDSVKDVSKNLYSVTEVSGTLTKRVENVTTNQKLRTFEFSGGKVLALTASMAGTHLPLNGGLPIHGTTILPYDASSASSQEIIVSGWIYIDSYNSDVTNGGGSCIMESVDEGTGKRGFGLIVTATGELVWRFYDYGYAAAHDATRAQQIKTQKKLELKTWHHFCVFAAGYPYSSSKAKWNSNGLDEKHQLATSAYGLHSQVAIYIDGQFQSNITESNPSGGITEFSTAVTPPNSNFPIVVGSGLGGLDTSPVQFQTSANFNGRLAELSWFWTIDMGAFNYTNQSNPAPPPRYKLKRYRDTIARILYTGKKSPTSGYNNVPPRVLLRDRDANTYHPTVLRGTDQRRKGNSLSTFDDSRAQTFGARQEGVLFPTKIKKDDILFDKIYSGYYHGNLEVTSTGLEPSPETYNTFYTRADQPTLKPFNESRVYIDSGSIFYQTGTSESILPGFKKPLSTKEMIVIDLSPVTTAQFGYTGSLEKTYQSEHTYDGNSGFDHASITRPNGVPSGSLMLYWDSSSRTFVKKGHIPSYKGVYLRDRNYTSPIGNISLIGNATSTSAQKVLEDLGDNMCSAFNSLSPDAMILSSSAGGGTDPSKYFSPSATGITSPSLESAGRPDSTFGFPFASKYDHTDTGVIKMSDYITEPFILEKMVYEFSASFELGTVHSTAGGGAERHTALVGFQPAVGGITNSAGPGDVIRIGHLSPQHYSFFVLRQFFNANKPTTITQQFSNFANGIRSETDAAFGSRYNLVYSGSRLSQKNRDMIGYGQVFINFRTGKTNPGSLPSFDKTTHDYLTQQGLGREVNVFVTGSFHHTGTFRMEFTPSVTRNYDKSASCYLPITPKSKSNNRSIAQTSAGTKTGLDFTTFFHQYKGAHGNDFELSTRSLSRRILGQEISDDLIIADQSSDSLGPYKVSIRDTKKEDSPYILLPKDNLIFGWNAPLELVDGFSGLNNSKNMMNLHPGSGKITLFGSYVKESKQRLSQLNQLLANDIVHESIGSESIHDQFDIEPSSTFLGSLSEVTISGSADFRNPGGPYFGYDADTKTQIHLARRVGSSLSQGTFGTTGSFKRNTYSIESTRIELDSYLFDLKDIFAFDERSTANLSIEKNRSYVNDYVASNYVPGDQPFLDALRLTDDPSFSEPGIDALGNYIYNGPKVFHNFQFASAYRFARYPESKVKRVPYSQIGNTNEFECVLSGSDEFFPGIIDGVIEGTGHDFFQLSSTDAPIRKTQPAVGDNVRKYTLTNLALAKIFFGIGDGIGGSHIIDRSNSFSSGVSTVRLLTFSGSIRGFRYGFSNIVEKQPKSVFRRSSYGQFRDLMEGIPNTAYVDTVTNTTNYPIEASFFDKSGFITDPDNTNCSNLSQYCTSSAPFFDRDTASDTSSNVIRNRGPIQSSLINVIVP